MTVLRLSGQGDDGGVEPLGSDPADEADADWSWRALRALRRFGPRTVPALTEALSAAPDPTVRRFAAASLGRLGGEAREAAGALRHAAEHDADPDVRGAALAALAVLAGDAPA